MRKIYWYLTTYIKKHGWVVISSIVGGVIIFSFLIPILAKKITIKQKQYIGLVGDYTLNSLPPEVKSKLSVGLTKIDSEDKTVKPLLAERWISQDEGKTYRFIVKKDVLWQDGKELTPEDIHYNFRDVETIATPNDVIFKLPDIFAPFPSVVSEPIFRQGIQKYAFFFKKPTLIGIGPYQITSYQSKNNRITQITLDSPKERLIYRFYLTERDLILAYKKGEVDLIPDLTNPRDLTDWSNTQVTPFINYDHYLAVFFNNAHSVFNKNVRQALAYATRKPADQTRAIGPINPNSWAYLEGGKDYEYDLTRAVERLLDSLPPEPMDLTLTTTSFFIKEAEELKKQWEELGQQAVQACQNEQEIENKDLCQNAKIKLNLKISNFPDTNNFELLLVGQEIPADPDQYFLWHSEQPTNFTNYKNTRIDSLLEKGRQTINHKERLAAYQEFQQFLLEDPPAVFLKYLYTYQVQRR